MFGEKLIAELFIASNEKTLRVNAISGHFKSEYLINFLQSADNSDIYIQDVIKEIKEKFGKEEGMYAVTCEIDHVEQEKQGEHGEYTMPGYYIIGRILSISEIT